MKSCGIFARFSAQSVSITPVSGSSILMRKPSSCQNCFTTGQSFSGVCVTTSQRCVPARSTRTLFSGIAGRMSVEPVRGPPARSELYVE